MSKVLSLNIRSWTRDTKKSSGHYWVTRYKAIHDYIKAEDPDVICLQEVWWPAKYALKLGKLGYKKTGWGFSHPIFVKKYMRVTKRAVSIFSTMAIINGVQFFSVHCRWEEKLLEKAMNWIVKQYFRYIETTDRSAIACGDFNTSDAEKITKSTTMTHARTALQLNAEDTFANYKRTLESHGEIDHFFCGWGVGLLDYAVGPDNLSDHKPIKLGYYKI